MLALLMCAVLCSPLQGKSETGLFEAASRPNPKEPKVWRLRPQGGDFYINLEWPEENAVLRLSGVFNAGQAFHSRLDLEVQGVRSEFIQIRVAEGTTMKILLCPNGADQRNAHMLADLGGSTYAALHLANRKRLVFTDEHLKQVRQLAMQVFRVLSEQGGLAPPQRPPMAYSIVSPGRPVDKTTLEAMNQLVP